MSDNNDINVQLLDNPVGSPLIDIDEPAAQKQDKPAPDADAQKTDIPDATDENAESQESKAETQEQQELKKESRRQRKLNRERDARIAAETENRILKEQLAARDKPAAAQEPGEPKREEFEDYESYMRAVARYDAQQAADKVLKADRESREKTDAQSKQQREAQQLADSWSKREKEFISKVPTFVEDVEPFMDDGLQEFSKEARQLIVEVGPELLHHLAMNEDVAEEIAKLSPLRQVAALGKIDLSEKPAGADDTDDERDTEQQAAQQASSKRTPAPPPAKHIRSGGSATAAMSDDMDTYIAQRRKQGARWAR